MARLTKRAVDAIRPGKRDQFIWDDELRGFGVRVYPSGALKYLLQWKRDGRTRRLVLGTHGLITCEEARNQARTKLGAIAKGHDPADERDARKRDLTLADFLDLYMVEGAGHLKPGSREVYRSAFERHVKPLLGGRKVGSLRSADVAKLQEDVANGRTARRMEGEARKGGRVGWSVVVAALPHGCGSTLGLPCPGECAAGCWIRAPRPASPSSRPAPSSGFSTPRSSSAWA